MMSDREFNELRREVRASAQSGLVNASDAGRFLVGGTASIEARSATLGENQARRFHVVAYNGGPMSMMNLAYPIIIDLQGLDVGNQVKPVFLDNVPDIVGRVLGQTDRITVGASSVIAEGEVIGTSQQAQRAIELNDKGFKWQSELGVRATSKLNFIAVNQNVTVNGKTFQGPCYIAPKSRLASISFVVLSDDPASSGSISPTADNPRQMSMV